METETGTGWASPELLHASFFLRACAVQALGQASLSVSGEEALPAVPTAAMAAALAQNLPEPHPSPETVLSCGAALQAMLEQQPAPTCRPSAIFGAAYAPAIAALPLATLLVLLRACDMAGLPAHTMSTVTACLAQRYASQPAAVFETEVTAPSPRAAALVRQWWEERFGVQQCSVRPYGEGDARKVLLSHSAWAFSSLPYDPQLAALPPIAFGLQAGASAEELWVRGLDCPDSPSSPPPRAAALLALTYGQTDWAQRTVPAAAASAAAVLGVVQSGAPPADRGASLLALLAEKGSQDAALAQFCCGALWRMAESESEWCTSAAAGVALEAVVGALRAHPGDDGVAQCGCGALGQLYFSANVEPGMQAALAAGLPTLAAVLLSPHLHAASTEAAAVCIRRILSVAKSPPIEEVVAAGVATRLVELLQWDGHPRVQLEACWALTNIASGTNDNTRAVIDAGALPHFVRLLDSPDADVREQAVWALGNIAGDSLPLRMGVLNAGVVTPLLRSLTPHAKLNFVRNATWTISTLVRSKVVEGVRQPSMDALRALLPRLAALLSTEDKQVLVDALWALIHLSEGEEDRVLPILESGCLPRVVALLNHPSKEVVVLALRTLGNIMTGDAMMTQSVLNADALPQIATLLQPDSPKKICKEACWLVSNVCAGTQSQIQAVLTANCVPALIHHMTNSDPSIARDACWALSNAATGGSPQQIYSLVTQGVIAPFLGMLLRIQDDCVRIVAIEGLEYILVKPPPPEFGQAPDLYRQHMLRAEVPQAMMHIQDTTGTDSPLHIKAKAFQRLHFPEWAFDHEEEEEEKAQEEEETEEEDSEEE